MQSVFVLAFVPGVTPGKWVSVWNQRLPATRLELARLDRDEALAALHDGTADVALLRLPFETSGLNTIPLYEELAYVVANRDHPVAAFDSLTRAELEGETVLDGSDAPTIDLVAANVGVAIVPQSIARLHARRDVVSRPLTDGAPTRIVLSWRSDDDNPYIEEFIGIVRGRTANSSRGATPAPPAKTAPKNPRAGRTRR